MNSLDLAEELTPQQQHRQVVRVVTAAWTDSKGAIVIRKTITPLKRLSTGWQVLTEDAENIGATEVVQRITNLHSVPDGVYVVEIHNIKFDWETGHIADYDYQLVPFRAP